MHGRLFTLDLNSIGIDLTIPFPSYFVLLLAGFIFATLLGVLWARRVGQNPDVVVDLGLAMLLAGVAGARLLHVFADGYFWDYVHLCTDPSKVEWKITRAQCLSPEYGGAWDMAQNVCRAKEQDCFAWAKFYAGGLAYYGGFVTASAAAWFLLRSDKFPFWKAADMAGMVIPIGLGFGRMGCLLAGCCFGIRTDGAMALHFPGFSPASEAQFKAGLLRAPNLESLGVQPSQVYESAASLALGSVLMLYLHGRKRYDGQVFVWFVVGYAALRFVIEAFRADDRGIFFGLSTSQWIGIALIGAAVYAHKRLAARSESLAKLPLGPATA